MWYSPQQLRAAFFMRPLPEKLTHKQRVTRQYKKVLVTLRDHAGFFRHSWYQGVGLARDQYELNRHLDNPVEIEERVRQGEQWLKENKHFFPYKRTFSSPLDLALALAPTPLLMAPLSFATYIT